ncbi:Ig-like domain-containing protein [Candidatus Neomarinimicrobiota bacterium]
MGNTRLRYPLLISLLAGLLNAQTIAQLEYFIDGDPGYGFGTSIDVASDTSSIDQVFSIDLTGISSGFHTLFVRIQDANGLWSLANAKPFYLEAGKLAAANDITTAEYFLDTDPGYGNGASIGIIPDSTIDQLFMVDLDTLSTGLHTLFVRVRDANGLWSLAHAKTFYLETGKLAVENDIVAAEYFIDHDPGYGLASPVEIAPDSTLNQLFMVNLDTVDTGFHTLFVRIQDANGLWSLAHAKPFYLEAGKLAVENDILAAEYFVDQDPGYGEGKPIVISPDSSINQVFMLDLDTVATGFHTLFVRIRDANGLWSLATAKPFYLDFDDIVAPELTSINYFFTGDNDFTSSVATYSNPLPSSNLDAEIWADLSELEQDSTYQLHITARDERDRVSMESAHSVLVAYGAFISVSLDTLPFGYLNIDSTTTLSFVIRNQGTPDSILTITELALSCSDFAAHADTTSIISGDSTLVMVTFAPTAPQVYGCDLTIRSNALDYPELTVHLLGRSSNSAPEARPDTVITDEDIGILINVLANDQDVDDAYLTIERFSQPSFGAASVTKAGLVAYTPSANYYGTDSLSYVVTDGHEAYDTASVSITIWPVNDPPRRFPYDLHRSGLGCAAHHRHAHG